MNWTVFGEKYSCPNRGTILKFDLETEYNEEKSLSG
jgi:hypothetical protein